MNLSYSEMLILLLTQLLVIPVQGAESLVTWKSQKVSQKMAAQSKFICQGTIEEKIDLLLESKLGLSKEIMEGGGELSLTEMTNQELLKLVALDIHRTISDN